jgi:putative flippase GtrA
MKRLRGEALRFLLVGGTNTGLDFALFALFANVIHVYPPLASVMSIGVVVVVSFFLNHRFVFRSEHSKRRTAIQFVAVTLFNGWVVQGAIIAVIVHFATPHSIGLPAWVINLGAKLVAIGFSMVLNFVGYRLVFTKRGAGSATPELEHDSVSAPPPPS